MVLSENESEQRTKNKIITQDTGSLIFVMLIYCEIENAQVKNTNISVIARLYHAASYFEAHSSSFIGVNRMSLVTLRGSQI